MSDPSPEDDASGNDTGRLGRLGKRLGSLTALANAAGTLWMFAIMFMILADVIGRNLFNQPLAGVPELVAYSIVGAVFLQMANTLYSNRFVRAEPLIDLLDRKRPVAAIIFHFVLKVPVLLFL